MKYFKNLMLLAIVTLLSYCVGSRVSPYPNFNYPTTDRNKVQIYYMPPTVPFEIIGEVEGRGALAASWNSVEGSIRRKAVLIGGDAIILVSKREPYAGTYTTPSTEKAFIYGNYIYYT